MRWGFERAATACAGVVAWASCASRAWADGPVDPSYGRVVGDATVVVGAGGVVAPRGLRAGGELRVRYLETAGLFATCEDGPLLGSGAEPQRTFAAGVEMRPLFLVRWLKGLESGRAFADLALDSMGLELGVVWGQATGGPFASRPGLEAGVGVELPLAAAPTGPWLGLRGGVRWGDGALASGAVRGPDDRAGFLAVTLAWHQVFATHLSDVGDEAPR